MIFKVLGDRRLRILVLLLALAALAHQISLLVWQLVPAPPLQNQLTAAPLAGTGGAGMTERLLEIAEPREVEHAIEQALSIGATSATAVRLILEQRRETPVGLFSLDGRPHLKQVTVAPPDLSPYGSLVREG